MSIDHGHGERSRRSVSQRRRAAIQDARAGVKTKAVWASYGSPEAFREARIREVEALARVYFADTSLAPRGYRDHLLCLLRAYGLSAADAVWALEECAYDAACERAA